MTDHPHEVAVTPLSLRDAADALLSAGLCVLPARRAEKRPALPTWSVYQDRLPGREEIEMWFPPTAGPDALCVVCGAVSGHLEMIDFDLEGKLFDAWRESVEAQAPDLLDRLVIEETPSGGLHVVYRCAEPVCGNIKLAHKIYHAPDELPVVVGSKKYTPSRAPNGDWVAQVIAIETRGEGGLFLCDPVQGYRVVQGRLSEVPTITAAERVTLLGAAWQLDELSPPAIVDGPCPQHGPCGPVCVGSQARPGDDFNARGNVQEILERHGWTLTKDGENQHWRRPGKDSGSSATLKNGVFYVFSSNAAPFEAHKGYSPFAVYSLLEHGGDFGAAASALAAHGYGAERTHGVDLSAFFPEPPAPASPLEPSFTSALELYRRHPALRPPVIHNLLREGETLNVIAPPKRGKSWLTLDLALAVTSGRLWLGLFETVPGEVLLIDNELHPETSGWRVPQVAGARSLDFEDVGRRLQIENFRGRLKNIEELEPYFKRLEPRRFRLIILDAMYRFLPPDGDENDNAKMARVYNTIDSYAERLRCSFVLVHHTSKGNQSGKSVTDVGAGAGAQSRATDSHLVLRPHEEEGVVVLEAAVRSFAPVQPVCLRWRFPVWDLDETLDPGNLKIERSKPRREPKADGVDAKPEWTVEQFVATFISEGRTREEIIHEAQGAKLSIREAKRLIASALAAGLLEEDPFNGRSAPRLRRTRAIEVTEDEL